ncbi:MAG: hypothetical protein HY735_22070 [Verrucomicrobia bacterium]|nr:hypothetical protein [Verrucomicrobiota bacterium]
MRIYDLVMTHQLDADDFFIHRVQQHCAERGLNFFLIDPEWVEAFYEKLRQGKVWAKVLINMHSEHHRPDDIYHRLVRLAFDQKTRVIDPPDIAREAFDKAALHPRLLAAGFRLPNTVIVPGGEAEGFILTDADRAKLGAPFVVKPSMGYGKRGVILEATSVEDLQRSQREWPDARYLLQERIVPRLLDGKPAYFRVFFAFGTLWFTWWNCFTDQYRRLLPEEIKACGLEALSEIVCRLASVTRMNFFSTEIALTEEGEFVLIDYVNDQCHMLTQSANPAIGVPDEIVAGIARCLVQGAQQWIHQKP